MPVEVRPLTEHANGVTALPEARDKAPGALEMVNCVTTPDGVGIMPLPRHRRVYRYNLLQTIYVDADGVYYNESGEGRTEVTDLTKNRVVSIPGEVFGVKGSRGLAVVDEVTGRIVAGTFHPGGVPLDPENTAADRYPQTLLRLDRTGPNDYPIFTQLRNKTFLSGPYQEEWVFDGVSFKPSWLRAPQFAPTFYGEGLGDDHETPDPEEPEPEPEDPIPDPAYFVDNEYTGTPEWVTDVSFGLLPAGCHWTDLPDETQVLAVAAPNADDGNVYETRFPYERASGNPVDGCAALYIPGSSAGTLVLPNGGTRFNIGTRLLWRAFDTPQTLAAELDSVAFNTSILFYVNDVAGPRFPRYNLVFDASATFDSTDPANRVVVPISENRGTIPTHADFAYQSVGLVTVEEIKVLTVAEGGVWNTPDGDYLLGPGGNSIAPTTYWFVAGGVTYNRALAWTTFLFYNLRVWDKDWVETPVEPPVDPPPVIVPDTYLFGIAWYDENRKIESAVSPWSAGITLSEGEIFQLDISGSATEFVADDYWNDPPVWATHVRIYIHRLGWGNDLLTGYPVMRLYKELEIPEIATNEYGVQNQLSRRLVTLGESFDEQVLLSQKSPVYDLTVPPPSVSVIVDRDRRVFAGMPPYSVGRVQLDATRFPKLLYPWRDGPDGATEWFPDEWIPTGDYESVPELMPTWGDWMEGRQFRPADNERTYLIQKVLKRKQALITSGDFSDDTDWTPGDQWTIDTDFKFATFTMASLIEGGYFDDDTPWTNGGQWVIDEEAGTATLTGPSTYPQNMLSQAPDPTIEGDHSYRIRVDTTLTAGHSESLEVQLGGVISAPPITETGVYEIDITAADATDLYLVGTVTAGGSIVINSVEVVEIVAGADPRDLSQEIGRGVVVDHEYLASMWIERMGTSGALDFMIGGGTSLVESAGFMTGEFIATTTDDLVLRGHGPNGTVIQIRRIMLEDNSDEERPWALALWTSDGRYTWDVAAEAKYEILGEPTRIMWSVVNSTGAEPEAVNGLMNILNLDMPGDEIVSLERIGDYVVANGRKFSLFLLQNTGAIDDMTAVYGMAYSSARPDDGGIGIVAPRASIAQPGRMSISPTPEGFFRLLVPEGSQLWKPSDKIQRWLRCHWRVNTNYLKYAHAGYRKDRKLAVLCLPEAAGYPANLVDWPKTPPDEPFEG